MGVVEEELNESVGKKLLWFVGLFAASTAFFGAFLLMPELDIINHVSAIWMTQSQDAAHGLLYRPILGPDGMTGGTRYFPLPIILLAGLYRLSFPLILGVHLLLTIFLILYIFGIFLFLRKLELSWQLAIPLSLLFLCPEVVIFNNWLNGYIDIIPGSLNIIGLAILFPSEKQLKISRCICGGLLFSFAFLTKFTSLYGILAVSLYLLIYRQKRQFFSLIIAFSLTSLLGLLGTEIASEGRFSQNFSNSALGGTSVRTILKSPETLFFNFYRSADFTFLLFIIAIAAFLASYRYAKSPYVVLAFLSALVITIIINIGPGILQNHLVDITALSLIISAFYLYRNSKSLFFSFFFVWGSLASTYMVYKIIVQKKMARAEFIKSVIEETKNGKGPLLSETPLIPLLESETPYMLDEFMIQQIAKPNSKLETSLLNDVIHEKFRAVIIFNWGHPGDEWDKPSYLTPAIVEAIKTHYYLRKKIGYFYIFKPIRELYPN